MTKRAAAPSMAAVTRSVTMEENVDSTPDQPPASHILSTQALDNAIRFFTSLDTSSVLRGSVKLHLATEELVKHATTSGLQPGRISTLVDVILSDRHKLSQAVRSKLVKCLIPSTHVPQSAAVQVVSAMSTKVFTSPGPSNLHSLLLRWLLLVFDYVDGYEDLHKLYNIIFCFINSYKLLPHACHLLFLLTTKQDVRMFRVHKLLELVKKVGPEPYLLGLLMMYKVYCPHLVSMRLDYGHKVFFKAHDAAWRSAIAAIVNQHEEEDRLRDTEMRCRRERARIEPKSKRQKLMVPQPHSAVEEIEEDDEAATLTVAQASNRIPYTQIESFTGFLESLDRIEFPSQMAACLTEHKLQLLLSCHTDPLLMARLCLWIQHLFAFGFKHTDKGQTERNEKLLQVLFSFSNTVQTLPVVHGFLESYLPTWDGHSYAPLIFSLITCVEPCSYNDLYSSILEPLHKLFFSLDVYGKTMCVAALTKLMRKFLLDYKSGSLTQSQRQDSQVTADREGEERESEEAADVSADKPGQAGLKSNTDRERMDTMLRLINFLDVVIVIGMRMEDDHYLLQTSSLDLLQLMSEIFLKYKLPLVCLPMRLLQRLLLSDCPATLARLCSIINTFREAFMALKTESTRGEGKSLTCDTASDIKDRSVCSGTEKFNSVLLDVLGMIWQGRMFSDRKHKYTSMFHFSLPATLQGKLRGCELTVYRGPAFLPLAYKFLRETQNEGKKLHPQQIEEFKEVYLQFLVRENFPEFKELVDVNIKRRKIQS